MAGFLARSGRSEYAVVGWGTGLRRTIVASALGLAGGVVIALPAVPATADTVGVTLDYTCGLASIGDKVKLRVTVTAPTTMTVGQPIDIKWDIKYRDQTGFIAPGELPAGGKLSADGALRISGPWKGRDLAQGTADQDALPVGTKLTLPSLVTGDIGATSPGEITIRPGQLKFGFTPPASEVMVNDDDLTKVVYGNPPSLWTDYNDRDAKLNDYQSDVHGTEKAGATSVLTFTGTGVEFRTERDHRAGPLDFMIDEKSSTANPSLDDDGTPLGVDVVNQGGHTLWRVDDLDYGQHVLTITNRENKWAIVDAFNVLTRELNKPPEGYETTCKPENNNVAFKITVGAAPTPTPDPTATPTPTNTNGNQNGNSNSTSTATATATTTVTATPKPTTTTTVTATATPQVKVTPKGAAQTGEAPSSSSGMALIGTGSLMLAGGALGGVALRRRRAAHAGNRFDSDLG
ncbi:hypothetical protein [Streptosporangium sp. KLBMP 9127]|nr:hypothetical protein [Streptosporangium sp. KLBMP 9127]